MSNYAVQRRKGVSPWLPVGFLLWMILMLTIFVAFYFAGGQGFGAVSFGDAFIYVLVLMLVVTRWLAPVFLAGFIIWLGYRLLIKKKLKPETNPATKAGPSSPHESTPDE